jgi:hypothetical protein
MFKKLGKGLLDAGTSAVSTAGKAGLKGAGWLTKELGKAAYNNGPAVLKAVTNGSVSVVASAASGVYNAGSFAVKTAGGYVGFNSYVGDTITSIDDSIQGIRDSVAGNIYNSSKAAGKTASGVAEITSLIGFMPLASTVVEHLGQPLIEGGGGYLAKLVRGNRIAFVDLEIIEPNGFQTFFGAQKDVLAIMYMPKDKSSNMAGFAVMNEEALIGMAAVQNEGSREAAAFEKALETLMAKKADLGLAVQMPSLSCFCFEIPLILTHRCK